MPGQSFPDKIAPFLSAVIAGSRRFGTSVGRWTPIAHAHFVRFARRRCPTCCSIRLSEVDRPKDRETTAMQRHVARGHVKVSGAVRDNPDIGDLFSRNIHVPFEPKERKTH